MTPRLRKCDESTIAGRRTLLGMKTRAGYSHEHISTAGCKRAQRAAERLLQAAQERRISR